MKLPRMPAAVCSPLGDVAVGTLGSEESKKALAMFFGDQRAIGVSPNQSPISAWQSFFHELTHLAMWDSGVHQLLEEKQEEAVCDAMGTLLAYMLKVGQLKLKDV